MSTDRFSSSHGAETHRSLVAYERLIWIGAVLCYGIGDTLTTFWGLSTDGVDEAGPIAGPMMDAYGNLALLAIKAVLFLVFYAVWTRLETPARVAVPFALLVVGLVVSLWNLTIILFA